MSLLLTTCVLQAQTVVQGVVKDVDGIPLPFANVSFDGNGQTCDQTGRFEFQNVQPGTYQFQVSYVGFSTHSQKIEVTEKGVGPIAVELKSDLELDPVVVSGTLKPMSKTESPVPVEVYSPTFFKKNPNPSIYEAMQNVNGVRPQLNCNVCNTGDIHINGMEGPYTMVLIDGMPIVSGLSTVYGLTGIPVSLVERIEIVKGPASTLYGSEAIGGLINVITKSPEKHPLFYGEIMATSWRESNMDLALKSSLGKMKRLEATSNEMLSDLFLPSSLRSIEESNSWRFCNSMTTPSVRFLFSKNLRKELEESFTPTNLPLSPTAASESSKRLDLCIFPLASGMGSPCGSYFGKSRY